jgi:hypothetical protein
VLVAFFCLLLVGAVWLLPSSGQVAFGLYTVLLCVLLVAVCWVKGEAPALEVGQEVNSKVALRQSEPTRRHPAVVLSMWQAPNPFIERTPFGKLRWPAAAARVEH